MTASRGGSVIDPQVVEALVHARTRLHASALTDLTPRELDVLREMAQGRGNAGIAAELHLSESSVEKHVNAIFTKLGLTTEHQSHRRVTAVLTFLRDAGPAHLRHSGTPTARKTAPGSAAHLVLPGRRRT